MIREIFAAHMPLVNMVVGQRLYIMNDPQRNTEFRHKIDVLRYNAGRRCSDDEPIIRLRVCVQQYVCAL